MALLSQNKSPQVPHDLPRSPGCLSELIISNPHPPHSFRSTHSHLLAVPSTELSQGLCICRPHILTYSYPNWLLNSFSHLCSNVNSSQSLPPSTIYKHGKNSHPCHDIFYPSAFNILKKVYLYKSVWVLSVSPKSMRAMTWSVCP